MRRTLLSLTLAAACLAVTAAAIADPLKTKNHLIVPGVSIGGVSINMSVAKAKAAWGNDDQCDHNTAHGHCSYQKHNGRQYGDAKFFWDSNRVYRVIVGEFPGFGPVGPVALMKTVKGIRLGSRMSAVRSAYPGAVEISPALLRIKGPRKHKTDLEFAASEADPTGQTLTRITVENPDYRNSR